MVSHSRLGSRWDRVEVRLELRLYLLWGRCKDSGSNSSVVVMGLSTLGYEFWSVSHPISGSLPGLILGSEPRLPSLDIAVSQKSLLLPGVLPMDIHLSSF